MTIEAKIIADSIGPRHPRLTTFELRYPRFVHSELMTHRMFSRNASSSRAIPVERQIASIVEDTAHPVHWGKNKSGMQADEETDTMITLHKKICTTEGEENYPIQLTAMEAWNEARDRAIEVAQGFADAGYHKQIVNRILEPYAHIKVVLTATNFENWFWLRRHPDAQPEMKVLADLMYDAMEDSTPEMLVEGQWHRPYITRDELHMTRIIDPKDVDVLVKVSVARCARVSYKTHDGRATTLTEDVKLYDRLVGSAPLHASPAEHQARLDTITYSDAEIPVYANPHLSGNFDAGWIQFRKTLDGEHMPIPDPLPVPFE